jgi:hypothetical protein
MARTKIQPRQSASGKAPAKTKAGKAAAALKQNKVVQPPAKKKVSSSAAHAVVANAQKTGMKGKRFAVDPNTGKKVRGDGSFFKDRRLRPGTKTRRLHRRLADPHAKAKLLIARAGISRCFRAALTELQGLAYQPVASVTAGAMTHIHYVVETLMQALFAKCARMMRLSGKKSLTRTIVMYAFMDLVSYTGNSVDLHEFNGLLRSYEIEKQAAANKKTAA